MDYEDRMKRGYELLEIMGRDTMEHQRKLYPDLHELSVGHLFGDIWTRPHLTLRERQLITLAVNIALARPTSNQSHFRSAHHIGITKEQIMELIIHVGHYAGWPTIAHATRQYIQVLEEDGEPQAKGATNTQGA
jgi:4-carboxymuconolactone decarboxylase